LVPAQFHRNIHEGLFGLQRAFKLLGVKQIFSSLWSVNDATTAEYMKLFYKNWDTGINTRSAYIKTQKELRNRYPKEPEKWAAFILTE
jgi:CHAT domain-containing protein